jgi:hypothetical protein
VTTTIESAAASIRPREESPPPQVPESHHNLCGPATLSACYWIPRDVYLCKTDDGIVFLDAIRNRYRAIDKRHLTILESTVQGLGRAAGAAPAACGPESSNIPTLLEGHGLLTTRMEGAKPFTPISLPAVDIARSAAMLDRRPVMHLHHVVNFAYAWTKANVMLRACSLKYVLRQIDRAHDAAPGVPLDVGGERAEDLFATFHRLRSLISSTTDRCLLISLALWLFMKRYRCRPLLIIGVSTKPFSAHCWLQLENLAFDGRPDRLDPMTPIFAR